MDLFNEIFFDNPRRLNLKVYMSKRNEEEIEEFSKINKEFYADKTIFKHGVEVKDIDSENVKATQDTWELHIPAKPDF